MKTVLFVFLVIGLLDSIKTDDDGRYRPDVYGDKSGKYSATYNGRYYNYNNNYVGRNGYYPNYAYQPQYYNPLKPNQQLVAPVVTQKDSSVTSTQPPVVVTTPQPLPSNYVYTKNYGIEGNARIIEQDNDQNENSYQYKYRTENGISAAETGVVDTSSPQGGTRVQGFYEYVGDDGLTYRVDYVADENGYRASGAHLPKAQV